MSETRDEVSVSRSPPGDSVVRAETMKPSSSMKCLVGLLLAACFSAATQAATSSTTNLTQAPANATQQQQQQQVNEMLIMNLVKNNFNNQNNNHATPPLTAAIGPRQAPSSHVHHFKSRAGQPRDMEYQSAYACDGNQLELSCQEGKLIHLQRVVYGRFSLSICNELGHTNYSVTCVDWTASRILETRCNKLSSCSVTVSAGLFQDPCPDTPKYLEVKYYCEDVGGHQSQTPDKQQQQQLATTRPQPPTETTTPANGHKSPNQAATARTQPQQQPPTTITNSMEEPARHSTVIQQQQQQQQPQPQPPQQEPSAAAHCPPADHQQAGRLTHWNWTRAGQLAWQQCPQGAEGMAAWLCDPERLRYAPAWSPDFSRCRTGWLSSLSLQLSKMLEAPSGVGKQAYLSAEQVRQQNERLVKEVLNDLALMAKSRSLFSEDLKVMDIMISQIIAQLRSLSNQFGGFGPTSLWAPTTTTSANQAMTAATTARLYEDLFAQLVHIVSSLFDVSQRQAWLELGGQDRRRLELRYLGHLRDAGYLLANNLASQQGDDGNQQQQRILQRQPNVFAGLTVISVEAAGRGTGASGGLDDPELAQQLKVAQLNLNKFVTEPDEQINDFKIQLTVLRELAANGVTRFLVLDVKKPDYQLIRQQLEADVMVEQQQQQPMVELQSARVFGVFAVGSDAQAWDNQQQQQQQQQPQQQRLNDLLAQWPISVDFRISQHQQGGQQLGPIRQCNSLPPPSDSSGQQQNRCQTLRTNLTNHVCRCEQFGFVSLAAAPTQLVPIGGGGGGDHHLHWPAQQPQPPPPLIDTRPYEYPADLNAVVGQLPPATYLSPTGLVESSGATSNQNGSGGSGAKLGAWASVFIVFGLALLVVTLAVLTINFVMRLASQRRLSKKQGFLSTGTSILGGHLHHHHHHRDLSGGPTTGPLTDHNLMGAEPLTSSTLASTGTNGGVVATNGSTTAGYKTHQQLYAAHYPPMDLCTSMANANGSGWRGWLNRPARWWALATGRNHHSRMGGIQHRVLGSTLTQASSVPAYKGQFHQNGYTATGLHHGHHAHHLHQHHHAPVSAAAIAAAAHLPLTAPTSSSTSSYVSSSAYYEEIGPGNLTKVNPNQLASNSSTHTVVEPFKQQRSHQPTDQQQLLIGGQQQQVWAPGATGLSYSMDQNNYHLNGNQNNTNTNNTKQQQLHSDLNQLQSQSSSSAGSQHSASTNITTANGSTPRHYLFASPSAVNAYKSSMSQHNLHHNQHHHHHQQQQQQQQHYQQQQRFLQN